MDSKLILIAMVVMAMSCLTLRTDAQTTTLAESNSTTASTAATAEPAMASTAATAEPAMASTAATAAPATASTAATAAPATASTAATGAPATASTAATAAPATASTAATAAPATASTAATGAPATASTAATAAPTMASTAATAASTGASTMASTAATTTATTAATTTTPALISNITVTTLTANISSDNCGKTQFCAAQPSSCDPASNSCYFVSSVLKSGQNVDFQISGPSTGYIALGLSVAQTQGSNNNSYICANNNGNISFYSAFLNGSTYSLISSPNVNNVKGVVKGSLIQCSFAATLPNTNSRSSSTSFFVSLSNGTFINGTLSIPNDVFKSTTAVDVSNPNSTTTNSLATNSSAANTTATPATAGEGPFHHFLSQALLIVLGVLGLAML